MNNLPVLVASGSQDRFIHQGVWRVPGGLKLILDEATRAHYKANFVDGLPGEFTIFAARGKDRDGHPLDAEHEFATDGKQVFQVYRNPDDTGWRLTDARHQWQKRGGISERDILFLISQR